MIRTLARQSGQRRAERSAQHSNNTVGSRNDTTHFLFHTLHHNYSEPTSLCTYVQSLVMISVPWLHQPYYYSNFSEKTHDPGNACWNPDRYWTLTRKAVVNDFLNEVILLHTVRFTDTVKCCHTEYLQLRSPYPNCLSVSIGIYVDKKCSIPVHPTFQKDNSLVAQ